MTLEGIRMVDEDATRDGNAAGPQDPGTDSGNLGEVHAVHQSESVSLRELLGDTMVYGLASVADRMIGFLLLPVMTAILMPADYGVISLFTTTAHILFIFCSLGIHQGFYRHYTEAQDTSKQLLVLNTSLALAVGYWLLTLPVFLLFSQKLNQWIFDIDGSSMVLALTASTLIQVIDSVACNRLQADGRRWAYFIVVVTSSIVLRASAIILVLLGMGAWGWVLSDTFGRLLAVLLLVAVAMPDARVRPHIKLIRPLASYGVMLVPALISYYFMIVSDKYLIRALTDDSLQQVGFYSVGERIAGVMQLVNLAFIFGWQRFAFRNMHTSDGPPIIARGILWFAIAGSYLALALAMLGDDLTRWFVAKEYAPGIVVITPLTLAALLGGLAGAAEIGLHKRKRPLRISYLNGAAAVCNIVLNFWAIPRWGIAGAAVATMVSQAFRLVFIWRASHAAFPLPFEYARFAKAVVLFILIYALGQLANPLEQSVTTSLQTLLVLLAPALLWIAGFFTTSERTAIEQVLNTFCSKKPS